MTIFLDENSEKQERGLGSVPVKLQHGSRPREDYRNYEDMATEFYTVNLLEADFSSVTGKNFAPKEKGYLFC